MGDAVRTLAEALKSEVAATLSQLQDAQTQVQLLQRNMEQEVVNTKSSLSEQAKKIDEALKELKADVEHTKSQHHDLTQNRLVSQTDLDGVKMELMALQGGLARVDKQ